MHIKNIVLLKFLLPVVLWFLSLGTSLAQDLEYGVEVDTNMIVIGDHIHFKLKVKQPDNVKVLFPELKDTIVNGIEIIEKKPLVTKKLDDNWRLLVQEYVVTSFDTGVYKIPALPFTIKSENFDNVVRSNELYIGVTAFAVDTTKGYFDIMMPIETPLSWAEILPYVFWSFWGLLVAALIVWLFTKYKRKEKVFGRAEKPKDPPHIIALSSLDKVKGEKLWQRGLVKEYYSDVTEVIRAYLENQFDIRAMEQTTDEIMDDVSDEELITKDLKEKLKDMLVRADFVKFAKAEPLADENHKTLTDAYDIVTETRKLVAAKQQKEEEERAAEEAKKKALQELENAKKKALETGAISDNSSSPSAESVEVKKEAEDSAAHSKETSNN